MPMYQKFRRCLNKLIIVDNTLEELRITTNHKVFYKRVQLTVIGLLIFTTWIISTSAIWHRDNYNNIIKSVYISLMAKYPFYINMIDDAIIISIFGLVLVILSTKLFSRLKSWNLFNNLENCCITHSRLLNSSCHYLLVSIIFRYIALKFDQINHYLRIMESDNKHAVKWAWQRSTLLSQQNGNSKSKNNEYITWIVMYYKICLI